MSYTESGQYVDRTAEDDAPHCTRCNAVLNFARDGIFEIDCELACQDCWLANYDATIARSEARAAQRVAQT